MNHCSSPSCPSRPRTGAGRRRREGGRHLPHRCGHSHRSGLDDDAGAGAGHARPRGCRRDQPSRRGRGRFSGGRPRGDMPDHAGRLPRVLLRRRIRPEDRGGHAGAGAHSRRGGFRQRRRGHRCGHDLVRGRGAPWRREGRRQGRHHRIGRVGPDRRPRGPSAGRRGACGGDQGGYLAAGQGTGCGGRAPSPSRTIRRDSSM